MLITANRVREACSASGTQNLTLIGAISGFSTFSSKVQAGSLVPYVLLDGNGVDWETGFGTLTSASELARTTVLDSSTTEDRVNSNEDGTPIKITLSTNQHEVFIGVHHKTIFQLDENGAIVDPGPIRTSIFVETLADMTALAGLVDNETVFLIGSASINDGKGGVFYWDAEDGGAEDGVDTFEHDTEDGLFKRVRFDGQKFVKSYSPGTNADRVELEKPVVLPTRVDASGLKARALSWLSGVSRLVFARADAANDATAADHYEIPVTKGGYLFGVYPTITALKAIDAAAFCANGDRALVLGATTLGDCEAFYVTWTSASSATADDALTFRPSTGAASSGNGRWLRVNSDPNATFADSDATPSIANKRYFTTAATPPSGGITDLDDGFEGQYLVIQYGGAPCKFVHDDTKLDLGGRDLWLNADRRRAEFIHRAGVYRLITENGSFRRVAPEDYGAKGDGSTDDAVALQLWLTAVTTGGLPGHVPGKTYKSNSLLTACTDGSACVSHVKGMPGARFDFSGAPTGTAILLGDHTAGMTELTATNALAADIANLATTITLSGSPSVAEGDLLYIIDETDFSLTGGVTLGGSEDYYRQGCVSPARDVSGGTITLDRRVRGGPYLSANANMAIYKSTKRVFNWDTLEILVPPSVDESNQCNGLAVYDAYRSSFIGVRVLNSSFAGIFVARAYSTVFDQPIIRSEEGAYTSHYGIGFYGSFDCTVLNASIDVERHCITISAGDRPGYVVNRNIRTIGGTFISHGSGALDMHGPAEDCSFINAYTEGHVDIGGNNASLIGGEIHSTLLSTQAGVCVVFRDQWGGTFFVGGGVQLHCDAALSGSSVGIITATHVGLLGAGQLEFNDITFFQNKTQSGTRNAIRIDMCAGSDNEIEIVMNNLDRVVAPGLSDLTQRIAIDASDTATATFTSSSGLLCTSSTDIPTGAPVQFTNSGGALPTGLTSGTTYYAIRVSATTVRLATTHALALAGTAISYTDAGTGTHTVAYGARIKRLTATDLRNFSPTLTNTRCSVARFRGGHIADCTATGIDARLASHSEPQTLTFENWEVLRSTNGGIRVGGAQESDPVFVTMRDCVSGENAQSGSGGDQNRGSIEVSNCTGVHIQGGEYGDLQSTQTQTRRIVISAVTNVTITPDVRHRGTQRLPDVFSGVTTHLGRARELLKQSFVKVSHTGDTLEYLFASVLLPKNLLGANGSLEIEYFGSWDNNANTKTPRVRIGGHASVISETAIFSTSSGLLATVASDIQTGTPIVFSNSGGALPTGISAATTYYAIRISATTYKLATTLANALAGTAIAYTDSGTGTHTALYGAAVFAAAVTTTGQGAFARVIGNRNSAQSQVESFSPAITNSFSVGSGAPSTWTIDFTKDQYIVFSGQAANSADTSSLEGYRIWFVPGP